MQDKIIKATTVSGQVYFGFGEKVKKDFNFLMHIVKVEEIDADLFLKDLGLIERDLIKEKLNQISELLDK